MAKETPDHHDAELALRVYDLRREAVLRESRTAVNRTFWPASYEDIAAVSQPEHPLNAAFRQTATYWEMVYGMVRHGIVHPEFFMETNGEGLLLFAKIAPHLEAYRRDSGPLAFRNAEWVAQHTQVGRTLMERFAGYIQKAQESRK